MKLLITLLFIFSANQAFADGLLRKTTPFLDRAVERIYNMGRHSADSGGIRSIHTYENVGSLKTFFILKEAMKEDPIVTGACWDFGEGATNECVRLVINHDDEVRANYQVSNIFEWLGLLQSWDFDHQWHEDLGEVERSIFQYIGAGSSSYSYGVDGIADTWTTILISKDKKMVMVISSDYGA